MKGNFTTKTKYTKKTNDSTLIDYYTEIELKKQTNNQLQVNQWYG